MADIESLITQTAKLTFEIYQDPPPTTAPIPSPYPFSKPFVPPALFFLAPGPLTTTELRPQHVNTWASAFPQPHLHPLEPDLSASILSTVLDRHSRPFLRYLAISILKHHSYWLHSAKYADEPALLFTYSGTLHRLARAYSTALDSAQDPSPVEQDHLRTAERRLTKCTFYTFSVFLHLVYDANAKLLDDLEDAYMCLVRTPRNESERLRLIADSIRHASRYQWIETYDLDLDRDVRLGLDEDGNSDFDVLWLMELEEEREELLWDLETVMGRLRAREGRRMREITNVVAGGGWRVEVGEWPPLVDASGVENGDV